MQEIIVHTRDTCPICKTSFGNYLMPSDDQSAEQLKDYKIYQPLKAKITAIKGSEKLRSLTQLKFYWAAVTYATINADTSIPELKYWNSKKNTDFQLKVALNFIDDKCIAVHPVHGVTFRYKSIAMKNIKHILATEYINQAIGLMAAALNMTEDDFVKAVKSHMVGHARLPEETET